MEDPSVYEERTVFCHFHQIHLPERAIEISRFGHGGWRRHLLQKGLIYELRKDIVHFLFGDASSNDGRDPEFVSRYVPGGNKGVTKGDTKIT